MLICKLLLSACLLLPTAILGQERRDSPETVANAVEQVKLGNFALLNVEQIATNRAIEAIPDLKNQFAVSKDELEKGKIADALVRLGDTDATYWNYLVTQATAAIDSDMPLSIAFDAKGKPIPGQISPEFTAWVKAHDMSLGEAANQVAFLPIRVTFLAETGDKRGVPLLRRALQSKNPMIVVMAAKGLALAKDKDSIPLIIDACKRSAWPPAPIAESLIFFDDPLAQREADILLPQDSARSLRDGRAKGATPFY